MRFLLLATLLCAPSVLAEDWNWSVTLTELGDQKISVIKVVREHTGLGLKESKDLVEAPKPKLIKEGLSKADADSIVAQLAAAGAKAEAKQAGARKAKGPRAVPADAEFDVRLEDSGPNKIRAIKVVRQLTGLGLAEARTVVESTPIVLKEAVQRDVAQQWANDLIAAGAKVTLTPKKP